MKRVITFLVAICFVGVLFGQSNTFKYEIRATGGLRIGSSIFAKIDSITLQAGKLRIMSGATLQKIAGHVLYTDTTAMLAKYALKLNPVFTGVAKLSTDTLATRAYARASGGGGTSIDTTSLSARIDLKAPIDNPTLTGTTTGTFSGNLTGNVTGSAGTIVNSTTSTGGNVALVSASSPTTVRYSPDLQYTELIHALSSTNFLAGSLTSGTYYSANSITSIGSASDIDFTITPKGTGVIKKSTTDTLATQAYARQFGGTGTVTIADVQNEIADSLNVLRPLYITSLETRVDSIVDVLADSINIETLLQIDFDTDTVASLSDVRSLAGSGVIGVTLNSGTLTLTGSDATADDITFYTNGDGQYDLPAGGGNLTIQSQVQGWINDSLANMKAGEFNVLDYGAISGDAVDDAAAINAAVTAAAAYMSSYFGDGRVIIPSGSYIISDSIHLASNVHIDIATGAYFNVGTYDGPVFYAEDEILQFATVSGGVFYSGSRLYTGIQLINTINVTDSYTAFCTFRDIKFHGSNIGIDFECANQGWVNSNYFENLVISDFVTGIESTVGANSAFAGNTFSHITLQSGDNTLFGLKDFQGSNNLFLNLFIWDVPEAGTAATMSGSGNYFIGGHMQHSDFEDNSTWGNRTMTTNEELITPIADRLWVYDNYADRDSIDKLRITGDVEPGTVASPAGDIGIKLGFASSETDFWGDGKYKNSANNSARIVADFTYPGSRLKFQTHGQTTNTTDYNNVMILDQYKGVSFPITNSGTITDATGITKAMQSRYIYYNEAAATDITANPQIADGYDGQIITILGSSDVNTLTLDDGTGLALTAQCVLGAEDAITLIYDSINDIWREVSRSEPIISESQLTLKADTIPLFIFGVGSGFSADTAIFNNGRLAGAFYNSGSDTLYVTELRGVLVEGTGTETIGVHVSWHVNMKDATATNLNTTALTVISMTTGTVDTTFDNNGIPPGVWVWCTLSGASANNKPTMLSLTMTGYRRNRSY